MEYPLISIAIPVYNTSKYLRKCLDSAIAQQYPYLEIVVLNNGSTDDSQRIIDEYVQKDNRVKSFTIEHVQTVKESKDNCYQRTTGDWIITLDSDDAINSEYVKQMWKTHILTKADMVIAQRVSVDEDGIEYDCLPKNEFDFSTCYSGKEALRRTITKWEMSVNGALVSKQNIFNIMLANPKCKLYSDENDSRILLMNATKVGFSKAIYYYTFNPNSVGRKDNWNRHRFRLNTRLGLLDLCESEYGMKSKEYQNAVTQSLGVALVAITHFCQNKSSYTSEKRQELRSIILDILSFTHISVFSIRTIVNLFAKCMLRVFVLFV